MPILNDAPGATDLDEEVEYVCDVCHLTHWKATGAAACDRQ